MKRTVFWLMIYSLFTNMAFTESTELHENLKLGIPLKLTTPVSASEIIPADLLLEKMSQGNDTRTQTTFLADPNTGRVWEIGPDQKAYSIMKLTPWKSNRTRKKLTDYFKESK